MIGRLLNHYKILGRLGKGGMGEVFTAEDTKLKRKVALKIMPEEIANDSFRAERFQREAETIAALNHPNIVTIYSIEQSDGIHFLTMELVEGDTLSELIPPEGMDAGSFLRLSIPITEALSAAHEKGIIHRDLKPGNIMVSREGRVKILDFGLAKLLRDDSDPNVSNMQTHLETQDGVILGTMPYMSPEQIQGKRLDQRSDIFSLGIIFYELTTGRRPFRGETSADLISSILKDVPQPLVELKPDLPASLEQIILRCLNKDPKERYQTAKNLHLELLQMNQSSQSGSRIKSAAPSSGELWIAVLPFKVSSADPEIENLADGLVQDITAALSQFSYLSVIPWSSTLQFKNNSGDINAISNRLRARYIMQGGIRKSGSLIRFNIQLIDAAAGTNLWAETYDRDLSNSNIFSVQDEITDRVAATVADNFGVLVRSMVAALEEKPPEELSAIEYVILFFGYYSRLTPQEHAKIRPLLEDAVKKIQRNADIWACLALVYLHEYSFAFNPLPNPLDRALMAAQRAVETNRTSQLAYEALAQTHFLRRELSAFPPAAERAMSLNPRNSNTFAYLALLLIFSGNIKKGAELTRKAMELNPHHAGWFHFGLIWDHYSRREYEKVLEHANRVNMPGFFWPPLIIASVLGHLDRKQEASASLKELLLIDPDFEERAPMYIEPWLYASGFLDSLLDGLRKAGLNVK